MTMTTRSDLVLAAEVLVAAGHREAATILLRPRCSKCLREVDPAEGMCFRCGTRQGAV